jgi:prepilin-type N-terminal cleavage/methylation domain-containing protein
MTRESTIKGYFRKGLTLVELLVVVAILALLVIAGIWAYRTQMSKGWDARRKADMDRIKVAVEEYEKDHDCYPPEELLKCNPGTGLKPYINQIPCDPRTKVDYKYEISADSCPRWFRLYSILDYRKDPIMAKINCTHNCGPNCEYQYYVFSSNTFDTTSCAGSGTPPPTQQPNGDWWGCINSVCVPLGLDSEGRPACEPNYSSKWLCDSNCSNDPEANACKSN